MIMVNYKLIENEQKSIDDIDRYMIGISYDVMLDPTYSQFRKKLAIEVLAKFVDHERHRQRIEVLHSRETDTELKQMLAEVLEGKFQTWIEAYAGERFGIESKAAKEDKKEQSQVHNKQESRQINNMLPFYRYQAKCVAAEQFDDDYYS
jgi:hypothetical protein